MSGLPVIYISKRCDHCIRLIKILYKKPELKGHYKIVSIDDSSIIAANSKTSISAIPPLA